MLADEYILIFLSLSSHIRLTEYISATLHNFNFSFSIGLSCRLTEHRIPAQQKAPPLAETKNIKMKNIYIIGLFTLAAITFFNSTGYGQKLDTTLSAKLWSLQDKELLIRGLERTRNDLMKEIEGLSVQQWNFKEESSRWSIAEIVEHLFAQHESYRIEMKTALNQPELIEFIEKAKGNDKVFIEYTTDTLKADAGFLSPIGRFCLKEKAIFAFNRTQDALINMVTTTKKDFRKHFTFRDYVFNGHLSNAEKYNIRDMHQLMLTCIAHMDRHLNQLRKVKKHSSYPL